MRPGDQDFEDGRSYGKHELATKLKEFAVVQDRETMEIILKALNSVYDESKETN